MKPVIQFALPSSMRPLATGPQWNALKLMEERGWEYISADPTIFRNLRDKGYVSFNGLRATLTEAGRAILKG